MSFLKENNYIVADSALYTKVLKKIPSKKTNYFLTVKILEQKADLLSWPAYTKRTKLLEEWNKFFLLISPVPPPFHFKQRIPEKADQSPHSFYRAMPYYAITYYLAFLYSCLSISKKW